MSVRYGTTCQIYAQKELTMSRLLGDSAKAQEYFSVNPDEASFMRYFGEVFEITSGEKWETNFSKYSLYFFRAFPKPAERYGLNSEILVLYAPYPEVQARSLSDIQTVQNRFKDRVHPIWNILITDDLNTADNIDSLLHGKDLEVYTIPFSRRELETKPSAEFIYDRLERYIRGRNLFDFQSGLSSDRFFFGRQPMVDDIVGKVENGQNFGLFGLRKIGKTSVLFAVQRHLQRLGGYHVIHIDCQLADFYLMHWNSLVNWICQQIRGSDSSLSLDFSQQGKLLHAAVRESRERVLLIFDEIENISFDLSPAEHWNDDFLHFWGTIRAVHQMTNGKITFGVAGVNPYVFDKPIVAGRDNPILLGGSPLYLWPLNLASIREMVRTIGRYMGLDFDEDVYEWLFRQFGGHPYLVRKACSLVYQKARKASGDRVNLADFTSRRDWLDRELGDDILKILIVLAQHYPSEFDHLMSLAKGEHEWIQLIYQEEFGALDHLLEYHVIAESNGEFEFVIGTLKRFLTGFGEPLVRAVQELVKSSEPTRYEQLSRPDQLELWTRVSVARNKVEPTLRTVLHRALLFKYGEQKALRQILSKFSPEKQATLAGHNLANIFSGDSKALFLKDAKEIAMREWDLIQHIFANDRKKFEMMIDKLNGAGRADAHANPIKETEVIQVEMIAQELLDQMIPFLA